jgi:ABC-2 type transport system ATP-binding protein
MASTTTTAAPVEAVALTKRFGAQLAVDDLTFSIEPGRITGFLGPNGAGKTTTLRMLVGLAEPTAGEALVFGSRYAELVNPTALVGTLLDASGFHPGRRARHELAIHAASTGVDDHRVDIVLDEVGLEIAADKRVGELSLGMRQRLGLAAALLGEPRLLVLDEPANGLDPAGMHWLRRLLRGFAASGTAVFVSSHVLAELALFADDVIVVNHGRLVVQSPIADLVGGGSERVLVRTPAGAALGTLLSEHGGRVEDTDEGLLVTGMRAEAIGDLAATASISLHQLRTETQTLEDVFLDLTDDDEAIR